MTTFRGAGGLLDRYVFFRFVGAYGVCLAGFLMLFLVMDFFGKLDDFLAAGKALEEAGLGMAGVMVEYYATRIPIILRLIAPYLTLFAGIATLLTLGRHNEVTPMVAAGRSHHRVLAPVYVFSIVVVFALVVVEEYVVPGAAQRHARLDALIEGRSKGEAKRPPHLRDRVTGNVLDAAYWLPSAQKLLDVHAPAYRDAKGRAPDGKLDAAELAYRVNPQTREVGWFPKDGSVTPALEGGAGVLPDPVRLPPDRPIAFGLTPPEIDLLCAGDEPGLPRPELVRLIERYPLKLDLAMQLEARSTRPVSSLVLLLLGLPFVTRPGHKSIAFGLLVALGTCAAYACVDFFFHQLGNRGDLKPLVASWFAPVLFGSIALARIDRVSG